MKTNRAARMMLKSRFMVFCLAVVGMTGLGVKLGESSSVRWVQAAGLQIQYPQAPNLSLGDLMAAAR